MSAARRRALPAGLWLLLIAVLAVALRVGYGLERQSAPDFREPLADAAFHDFWARGLATGEWTPPAGEPDPRIDEVPFLRPPGYPYFLAGIYRVCGVDPRAALIAQMLLGLANVFLAGWLGSSLLGRAGGRVLAGLVAISWIGIYFEGELQAPVLAQFGATVTLLLLLAAHRRGSVGLALAGGLALGLTALVRANVLLFVPVAAAWLFVLRRRQGGGGVALAGGLAVLLGAVLAVAPVAWRNHRVSGEFVPISLNGGINLYIGNNEEADGESATIPGLEKLTGRTSWNWFRYGDLVEGLSRRTGVDRTYAEVSDEFVKLAGTWIRENPGAFVRLCGRRAALFWGPREISNNKAIRFEKNGSRVLRALPGYPLLLVLSLLGAGMMLRERRDTVDRSGVALVGLFLLAVFLSYVPFLAAARFRAPLMPFVLVFAAYALVRAGQALRAGRPTPVVVGAAAVGALAFGLGRAGGESPVDRAWWHTDRAVALMRQERIPEAEAELRAALEANPGYIDAHHRLGDLLRDQGDPQGALQHYQAVVQQRPDRTDLMMKAAVILLDLQEWSTAEAVLEQVERIVPDSPDAYFERGRALVELGRPEQALTSIDRALELAPDNARAWVNRGIALAKLGRHEEAVESFENATELAPFLAESFQHLGRSMEALGRIDDATLAYDQARRLQPSYVDPRVHLGNLANARGDFAQAIRWYMEARTIDPDHVTTLYNLAGALANAGRLQDAVDNLEHLLDVQPDHALAQERLRQIQAILSSR